MMEARWFGKVTTSISSTKLLVGNSNLGAVLCVVLLQRKQKDENRDRRHRSRQKPLITQTEDGRQTGRDANGVCCDH